MSWSQKLSMLVCVAFGFVYFIWVAWTEGLSFWLVAGLVGVIGVAGFFVHRWMDAARPS